MPVVVFRGIEGWCDRLQVLAHCIGYCLKFNTALCVDWDDMVWGAGEFDFNSCFELVGIRTMTKTQVLKLVASGRMDVRPSCWDLRKMAVHIHGETHGDAYIGEFMKFEIEKVEGDVLVTNGRGERQWDVRLLCEHLRFKPAVVEGIKKRLADFDPNSVVIHLRGTDRPDKGDYTEKAVEAVKATGIPHSQVYVVTDQRDLWERFHAGIPEARLTNPESNILRIAPTNANGTHQIHPAVLKSLGVTKWDMMLDLMADWVALVSAQTAIGRSESTYFSMARSIHAAKWSKLMVQETPQGEQGWFPPSKTSPTYNETLLLPCREQTEIQRGTGLTVPDPQDVC